MPQKVIAALIQNDGLEKFVLVSAATTNPTYIKKGPCKLYGWYIGNTSAAFSYVCFHDIDNRPPVAGANVDMKLSIPVGGAANVIGEGIQFNNGLAITTVTGAAINNTTAVAASDLVINLFYR